MIRLDAWGWDGVEDRFGGEVRDDEVVLRVISCNILFTNVLKRRILHPKKLMNIA